MRDAVRRRWFWALLATFDLALLGGGGALAWRLRDVARVVEEREPADGPAHDGAAAELLAALAEERAWRDPQYVVDPVVGHRPKRSLAVRLHVGPLGGEPVRARRLHNNLGLIRADDLFELPAAPRVLFVGDSHSMGVVANADNASDVLERRLRAAHADAPATVLNASAGYYSLWQLVLRSRTLADALRPQLFVLSVFLGNDLLELEDRGRPHLDDDLVERPAADPPPPQTTSARLEWLRLTGDEPLFWQGLNQAAYLHLHPERLEPLLAKAGRCLDEAAALAARHDARLVVALIPSYDLLFPERVARCGERAMEAVRAGGNARLRAGLLARLAQRGIACADLHDALRADGRDELYATDYHLFVAGHRLLAEALLAPVAAALDARTR